MSTENTAENVHANNNDIRTWSQEAQTDPALVAVACKHNISNIYYVPKTLRDDYVFMVALVQNIGQLPS